MNPLLQGHSGTTPETSRNAFSVNQGTSEDDSQSDPHPDVGHFHGQTSQNSGPEVGHYSHSTESLSDINLYGQLMILMVFCMVIE